MQRLRMTTRRLHTAHCCQQRQYSHASSLNVMHQSSVYWHQVDILYMQVVSGEEPGQLLLMDLQSRDLFEMRIDLESQVNAKILSLMCSSAVDIRVGRCQIGTLMNSASSLWCEWLTG
jgi:hypothetical protein